MGRRREFVIGAMFGAIPLAAGLIAVGVALNSDAMEVTTGFPAGFAAGLGSLELGLTLYLLWWLLALGLLVSVGYRGFALEMVVTLLASPVIYYISYMALANAPRG